MSNRSDPSSNAHLDDYPLSPQSPSAFGPESRRAKLFHPSQPQPPTSPTHSSTASITASNAASPPYLAAFTPPSSVPMSAQTSQTSQTSLSAGQSITSAARSDLQLDASQPTSAAPLSANMSMDVDSDAARPKRKAEDMDDAETTPGKRTRLDEAQAPQESAQDSQEPDLGRLYCLRNRDYTSSRPHATQNLISLYGLDGIASSVARFDPTTGAKINRIRQSYEGYLKHLPGRAKLSGKKDKDDRDEKKKKATEDDTEPVLWGVLQMPDEEYHIQRVAGKDIREGVPEDVMADLMSKLESATQMNAGRLPGAEDSNWRHIVTSAPAETKADKAKDSGHDKAKEQQAQSFTQPGASATSSPNTGTMNSPTDGDSTRGRRNAKRRYNDDSYEGYGEGFEDDDGDLQSPDDADDPTNSLRRKKRKSTASSPRYPSFSGTYNSSSTVSVGYGSR